MLFSCKVILSVVQKVKGIGYLYVIRKKQHKTPPVNLAVKAKCSQKYYYRCCFEGYL